MRRGHHEAQVLFERLGSQLGHRTRRTWTRQHPTDGVWLLDTPHLGLDEVPLAALEVVVTETGKALRGSITTLEMVSPALGILLIQDREIRRGLIRSGTSPQTATEHLRRLVAAATADISRSRQRLALWTFDQLERRTQLTLNRAA